MTSTKKIDSIVKQVQLIFVVLMYSIFSSHKQLIMKHEFRKNNENYKEFNIDYIHKKKLNPFGFLLREYRTCMVKYHLFHIISIE